jgi:hypothetical protein
VKRWYLSPITGNGIAGTKLVPANPYRALAQDRFRDAIVAARKIGLNAGATFRALIPSNPVTGAPLRTWTLCEVDAPDFTALDTDTTLALLAADSDLEVPPTAATDLALAKFSLLRDASDKTIRDVIRRLVSQLDSAVDATKAMA